MDEIIQVSVPTAATMDRSGFDVLDTYGKGLHYKEPELRTCQELFACQTKREFKISPLEQKDDVLYTAEETTFFWRFCCSAYRPLEQTITAGGQPGGPILMNIKKPAYKCCSGNNFMDFSDAEGKTFGKATITAGTCLTGWCTESLPCGLSTDIYDIKLAGPGGDTEYHIHQPTCCGGYCVYPYKPNNDNFDEGIAPFYIYKPDNDQRGQEIGRINSAVFNAHHTVFVQFPEDADAETKARLLGTSIFIHHLFFETSPYTL